MLYYKTTIWYMDIQIIHKTIYLFVQNMFFVFIDV